MKKLKFDSNLNSLLKKVSRTIYLSISILPGYLRAMLGIGYLVCRAMDTIVDSSSLRSREKEEILNLFPGLQLKEEEFFIEKLKTAIEGVKDKQEKELLEKYSLILDFIKKLPENEKKLLLMLVKGVAMGMKMDLKNFEEGKLKAFKTQRDLINYCRMVGGVPGIYWYKVYAAYTDNKLRDYDSIRCAYDIGIALQLTNILRDLKSDLEIGRCYIPLEDLNSVGLQPEDILIAENIDKLKPVLNKFITYAVDMLDSSEKFLSLIGNSYFRMKAAVIWTVYWAMDTLYEIAQNNPLAKKNKISRKKIYSTIAKTPSLLISNEVFKRGYRFRRETLIVAINEGI